MTAGPHWEDGWLKIPYRGEELTVIEIGVGPVFTAAYRDWAADGTRVVQIRAPAEAVRAHITVRAGGQVHDEYPGSGHHVPAQGTRHGVT